MSYLQDTIAAIATPRGNAGIGVIRCSGSDAFFIAGSLFSRSLEGAAGHTALYGVLSHRDGRPIDRVLMTVFRGPASYTGEDTVEISCHGSRIILEEALEALLEAGARLAEQGEFTRRAYLNGKLDLSRAEAVNDVITAGTREAKNMALRQLEGGLGDRIAAFEKSLLALVASIEAAIDFPEDVPEPDRDTLTADCRRIRGDIHALIGASERAHVFRDGIRIALAGSVNAGKSSLLNALLERNRAIVTDIPGTTRDTLEEQTDICGIPCLLIDTAGVRETRDPVESRGVARTLEAIRTADLTLVLFDSGRSVSEEDRRILELVSDKEFLPVINKTDLGREDEEAEILSLIGSVTEKKPVRISAAAPEGIDLLVKTIYNIFISDSLSRESVVMTNLRHTQCLKEARESLDKALDSIGMGLAIDFVSIDLRGALLSLGRITGSGAADDLLDTIFSGFCIGK